MINKKITLCLLFISVTALCAGSFYEVYLEGHGKEQLMETLYSSFTVESSNTFWYLLKSNLLSILKSWLYLLLCPIVPILIFTCPFICILKSFSAGFSSTMIIETFGAKGIIYIITTILPQNIIHIPVFCVLSALSIHMSLTTTKYFLKRRQLNKNVLQKTVRHYITTFFIGLIILFISCLIEVFLKKFLL